jgi:putative peptidoglycan lipid II flippase
LYYANRLVQFPLALFGTAIATVTLPLLSRSIAENNLEDMKRTLSLSLRMVIFTIIPSAIGLIILGKPIITVLFQRGEFSSLATMMTSSALFFYSLGLFADASVKIVVSAFYSFQDTRTPVKTASICMIINIVLDIILMRILQVGGLALATAIASFVNMFLLFILLRKRIGQLGGKEIVKCFIKTAIAGIIMGVICYFVAFFLFENKYLKVSISLLLSIIVFIAAAHILKIKEMESVWKLFAKKES